MTPSISIVIPAFNEEHRIGRTIVELAELCRSRGWDVEVIVVDDGSTDETLSVAESCLESMLKWKVISSQPNRGKGHAVRQGMLAATGDLRFFMDADGSTALNEIGIFAAEYLVRPSGSVIIGSIAVPGADVTPQPWTRQIAGRAANWLIRGLVLPGIRDTQRGFKLFPASAAELIFSRTVIDGWLFDVEALALARRFGYSVIEMPIQWEHREDSRVTGSSYLRTFADLLRLRFRLWSQAYRFTK